MSKNITYSQKITPCRVLLDGTEIGIITRSTTNKHKYVVNIDRICWRRGKPTPYGSTVLHVHSLVAAKLKVVVAVEYLHSDEYLNYQRQFKS